MSVEGAWEEVTSITTGVIQPISEWCYEHPEVIFGTGGLLVLFGSAMLIRNRRRIWMKKIRRMFHLKRGKTMTRKEWNKIAKIRINSAIVSGIEDAVANGEIKSSDANRAYRSLAFFLKDNDFKRQQLPKDQRLSNAEYEILMKMLFNKVKPRIPGSKPGEIDNVHVYSKGIANPIVRKFGDKARRRV